MKNRLKNLSSLTTVSDEIILSIAEERSIPVPEATSIEMEKGFVPLRYIRNIGTLSISDQVKICRSKIVFCGCGGLGGFSIHAASRLGFGYFKLVDPDVFEPSNGNRQPFCLKDSIGIPKVKAILKMLREVNPLIEVTAITDKIKPSYLEHADIVMDGLDNPEDKLYLEEISKQMNIPLVHGAVRGWWGQVTTLLPDSMSSLRDIYSVTEKDKNTYEEELGTLVTSVGIIASIQINEAVRIVLGKKPLYENKLFYWDGETGTSMVLPL